MRFQMPFQSPNRLTLSFALLAILTPTARAITVEAAKQALNEKWQTLRPESAKERNVLFQSVTPKGTSGFIVTATVRDYETGYPRNRYYGRTCIGQFTNVEYTIWYDGAKWHVDGMLTAPNTKCTNNPSEGVSSIPLQSLSGTPAPAGPPPAGAAPLKAGGLVQGAYECWAFKSARMGFNFSVRGPGQYTDSAGTAGSFRFDPSNQRVQFQGGILSGLPRGFYAMYYEPQGVPTLSIRNSQGLEDTFCQNVRR